MCEYSALQDLQLEGNPHLLEYAHKLLSSCRLLHRLKVGIQLDINLIEEELQLFSMNELLLLDNVLKHLIACVGIARHVLQ